MIVLQRIVHLFNLIFHVCNLLLARLNLLLQFSDFEVQNEFELI